MSEPQSAADLPAAPEHRSLDAHPMDPRRGPHLSPRFAALLCWLLDLPAMTEPGILGAGRVGGCVGGAAPPRRTEPASVDAARIGDCVFAATTEDRSYNLMLGSWQDCRANLRGWGAACAVPDDAVDAMIETVRIGGA